MPTASPVPARQGAETDPHPPAAPVASAESGSVPSGRQGTTFAFASCQYPAGLMDRTLAGRSIDRLNHLIGLQRDPSHVAAVLLLGDQIYADASYGLLDPKEPQERYRSAHDAWWEALTTRENLIELDKINRLFIVPDDHEIADNWESVPDLEQQRMKDTALREFARSRGGRLPQGLPSHGWWGAVPVGGGHEVFMLDTRTRRDQRPWGSRIAAGRPHIIDDVQREELAKWLRVLHQQDLETGTVRPKLVSSAVWLLPRQVGRLNDQGEAKLTPALSDAWDGYPESLQWLLTLIASLGIRGVVVLCGDGHLAGHTVAQLTCDHHQTEVHVLHAPALYAPFPFANARPHEYATREQISWTREGDGVVCDVDASLWPLGDGFVQVDIRKPAKNWEIRVTFDTIDQPRSEYWTVR